MLLHPLLRLEAVAASSFKVSEVPAASADLDEGSRCLLELNRAIAAGEIAYDPFG